MSELTAPAPPSGWEPIGPTRRSALASWVYKTPTGWLYLTVTHGHVRLTTGPGYGHPATLPPAHADLVADGIRAASRLADANPPAGQLTLLEPA